MSCFCFVTVSVSPGKGYISYTDLSNLHWLNVANDCFECVPPNTTGTGENVVPLKGSQFHS